MESGKAEVGHVWSGDHVRPTKTFETQLKAGLKLE